MRPTAILFVLFMSFSACAKNLVVSQERKDCRGENGSACGLERAELSEIPEMEQNPPDPKQKAPEIPSGPIPVEQTKPVETPEKVGENPDKPTPEFPELPRWDCQASFREAEQRWTCNAEKTIAFKCLADQKTIVEWHCLSGKSCNDRSTNHFCEDSWQCRSSACRGDQLFTCHEGSLFKCTPSGEILRIDCGSRECISRKAGCDDVCLGDDLPTCKYSSCG